MVRNNSPDGKRSHMTAFVSDDDGATWKGGLQTNVAKNSGARLPIKAVTEGGTLFIRPERVVDVRCPVAEACIIASRSMFTN